MKKFAAILAILMLFLTGCVEFSSGPTGQAVSETPVEEEPAVEGPEPVEEPEPESAEEPEPGSAAETEEQEEEAETQPAESTEEQIVQIALEEVDGDVVSTKLNMEYGEASYVVEIECDNGSIAKVVIPIKTKEVMGIEWR